MIPPSNPGFPHRFAPPPPPASLTVIAVRVTPACSLVAVNVTTYGAERPSLAEGVHVSVPAVFEPLRVNTAPFPGAPPVEKEFLVIAYDGQDKLYVPVDQVDRVQKYIGSEGGAPSINKLGGTEWLKATAKAKRQVKEIAGELIALYAARQAVEGHAYAADTPWVQDMELAFPYTETPDQLAAIEDVKRDLEAPRPMDRPRRN